MLSDDFERMPEDPPEGSFEWVEARLMLVAQVYSDGLPVQDTSSLTQFDMIRDEFNDRPDRKTTPIKWTPRQISEAEEASSWLRLVHPVARRKVVGATVAVKVYRNYAIWSRVRTKLRSKASTSTLRRQYRSGIEMIVRRLRAKKT